MPIECEQLAKLPENLKECPVCFAGWGRPFKSFMRGQVQKNRRWFSIGPKRDYCAIICYYCKQIVGWDSHNV